MRRFVLVVIAVALLSGSVAQAASYQATNGDIVDPILDTSGSLHGYSGNNLEPGANLYGAFLTNADLGLTKLETLFLGCTQITDAGLVHLEGLANLQWLGFNGTQITDTGIAELKKALLGCDIFND